MNTIDKISAAYRNTAEEARQELNKVQQKIYRIGTLRLLLFVAGAAGIIYFRSESWGILAGIALVTLLPFLSLMKYHNRLFHRKDYLEKKMEINEQELAALDYDTSSFDDGEAYVDPAHLYTYDLDVFGPHSLFQYINRTCTQPGKHRLARWLGKHLERKEEIIRRQEAVGELAPELKFRQRFRILGLLYKGKAADETELCHWAESPCIFRSRKLLRLLPVLVAGTNLICLALAMTGMLPASICGIIWTCFVIAGFGFTGKVTKMQAFYGKKLQILSTYAALLHLMEKQPAQAALLKEIKQQIGGEKRKASHSISRLNKLMDELDQRNNVFMYVILNGLFFWELRQIMRIEAWKEQYAAELPGWLDAIGQMDALNSLATFAYNHPDYIYPSILQTEANAGVEGDVETQAGTKVNAKADSATCQSSPLPSPFRLRAEALGHPLMNRDRCVRNDIDMAKRPFFIIITGANMAGKSTYLRTVGINYLLGCIGAPVCARQMEICPARLVTSLRTSDSLNDNESYFFAELKRLKLIIDKLQAGEELFIILDEILKGTNSMDKQKGSFALIKQFMTLQANGIIATHDLLLGTLIDLFPDDIRNYRFEADITDNELTFSYRLRPGIAQNMNACFLMKKMGIAVAD
ncbi:MutS family DNA mismatch repair protein [uncultured Bacteroides sp.]|uniref:MutS family DNA mismatch repair protein n=1 Tax=uncultured Bacteroides sp. TaxID=162156 RepID=UPI0025908F4E|nr:MutS family DNA mismatch repair protein [uncultured Bacteroides sp.]